MPHQAGIMQVEIQLLSKSPWPPYVLFQGGWEVRLRSAVSPLVLFYPAGPPVEVAQFPFLATADS